MCRPSSSRIRAKEQRDKKWMPEYLLAFVNSAMQPVQIKCKNGVLESMMNEGLLEISQVRIVSRI